MTFNYHIGTDDSDRETPSSQTPALQARAYGLKKVTQLPPIA